MKENSKAAPILAINSGRDTVKHSNLIICSAKPLQQSLALMQSGLANSCTISIQSRSAGTRQGLFPAGSLDASILFWAVRQFSDEDKSHLLPGELSGKEGTGYV